MTGFDSELIDELRIKLNGKSKLSYSELAKWCSSRTSIPDDEHKMFVFGHEIKVI